LFACIHPLCLAKTRSCSSPKLSRGSKRGGSGGVGVNTIIDSVQQEDPKEASPVRVERAYIRAYMKDRPKVDPNYAARL
jgi:hypothetical protein